MSDAGKALGTGILGAILIGGKFMLGHGCSQAAHHAGTFAHSAAPYADDALRAGARGIEHIPVGQMDEVTRELANITSRTISSSSEPAAAARNEDAALEVLKTASKEAEANVAKKEKFLTKIVNDVEFQSIRSLKPALAEGPKDWVVRTQVIGILPDDDAAYFNVFQKQQTAGSEAAIRRSADRLMLKSTESAPYRAITSSRQGAQRMLEYIDAIAENHLIVIFGHSEAEDGSRVLYMPNGTKVPIDELMDYGRSKNKQLLIVTCFSDLTPNRPISVSEGLDLAEHLKSFIDGTGRTQKEIFDESSSYLAKKQTEKIVVYVAVPTATGTVYASLKLNKDRESSPKAGKR